MYEKEEKIMENKKSGRKIWWFQKKAVPLQPLLRNASTA
jgi:hypothetical protein